MQQSLGSGKNTKKGQKHQNRRSFAPQFNERLINLKNNTPLDHLCFRCVDQIKWKLQFAKYKQIKQPQNCNKCQKKNIVKSYRHVCDSCADKLRICAKCQAEKEIKPVEGKEKSGVESALLKEMQEYLKTMRERSRRKVLRLVEQGLVTYNKEKQIFEYNEEDNKPVEGLLFKGEGDEDSLFGDEDLDDDEEEEEKNDQEEEEEKQKDEKATVNILDSKVQVKGAINLNQK